MKARFLAVLETLLITGLLIWLSQFLMTELKPKFNQVTDKNIVIPLPSAFPTPVGQLNLANLETAKVKKIIDGDTIVLTDGRTVRYIGIDTPETVHPSKPVQCFGQEASAANKVLVADQSIWLEKDVSDVDKYHRLLRYVYISKTPEATNSADLMMINAKLVSTGFAYASSYPPDVKYQQLFSKLETQAIESAQGLWGVSNCARTK